MKLIRNRMRAAVAITCALCLACCASKSVDQGGSVADARYQKVEVEPNVWSITEEGSVNVFLVIGEKKALLIDSGYGGGNLAEYAEGITKLPIILVNTHGHSDHTGANRYFKDIYAHPADMNAVLARSREDSRFTPVEEGYTFDLGGRTISVIETPGHTAGHIALLDADAKILFTGDNNNSHVWLFMPDAMPLETYATSLKKLIARSSEFRVMYIGHGQACDPSFLSVALECARRIESREATGSPYRAEYPQAVAYDYENVKIIVDRQ